MKNKLVLYIVLFILGLGLIGLIGYLAGNQTKKDSFKRVDPKTEFLMLQDVRLQYEANKWRVFRDGHGKIKYQHYENGSWVWRTPDVVKQMKGVEEYLNKMK